MRKLIKYINKHMNILIGISIFAFSLFLTLKSTQIELILFMLSLFISIFIIKTPPEKIYNSDLVVQNLIETTVIILFMLALTIINKFLFPFSILLVYYLSLPSKESEEEEEI